MVESFGERLGRLRRAKGYSQRELGWKLGYGQPYISMWESGQRPPVAAAVASLAKLYSLSEAEVWGTA